MDIRGTLVGGEIFNEIQIRLTACATRKQLDEAVPTIPFENRQVAALLGLGIISLLRVDVTRTTIVRISFTDNEFTRGSRDMGIKSIEDMKIPLNYANNFIAKAIRENHYMITTDWQYLFNPVLTPEQARFIQAGGGIACSVVYPMTKLTNQSALVYSYYETLDRIGKEHHNFMARYSTMVQKTYQNLE